MARTRSRFRCVACDADAPQWAGRCTACGEWNALVEELEGPGPCAAPLAVPPAPAIGEIGHLDAAPRPTGLAEVDRVLAGGLVPGASLLLGGAPGIGKSTLVLQVAAGLAASGARVLVVSAEESAPQVRLRADRLGAVVPGLHVVAETDLGRVLAQVDVLGPDVVLVDSIQTVADGEVGAPPGSVPQVRACAARLVAVARSRAIGLVLVGHVTKEGGLAGPRTLEHLVDTVLTFEGERHHALRLLRATKHRFGPTDELGVFEMARRGLVAVKDPSALLLADRAGGVPGSAVVPTLDGHRPLLVEVQALVARERSGTAARSAQGLDRGRLGLLLAVLDRVTAEGLSGRDVYTVAVGGVRLVEPGADLALLLALVSAWRDRPLPADLAVVGEVGLGGEVRQVRGTDRRLREVARLGFRHALVPANSPAVPTADLRVVRVGDVGEALAAAGLAA